MKTKACVLKFDPKRPRAQKSAKFELEPEVLELAGCLNALYLAGDNHTLPAIRVLANRAYDRIKAAS